MVDVLVIPDGAAEPVRAGVRTALERARTPALDALAAAGTVLRVATTPPGLPAGSETGIPTLLGAPPAGPVSRGRLEAAAHEIAVDPGSRAWRVDVRAGDGRRASGEEARTALPLLRRALPGCEVHHLRGHRYLAVGIGPAPASGPLPGSAGLRLHVWPDGAALEPVLDTRTVVVCAPGAAAGCARLLGAAVSVPAFATGGTDTSWAGKRAAALRALDHANRVVVHVGAPDEAAHMLDVDAKVAALETIDRELIEPLRAAVSTRGGRLAVCSDHATDPRTGEHDAEPVPAAVAGTGVTPDPHPARMTERAAAGRPIVDPVALWARAPSPAGVA